MANPNASVKVRSGRDDVSQPLGDTHPMAGETFGANLKLWRKHRGLTQQQLAERVGTSKGHISDLEAGKKAFVQDMIELLAVALNTTPGQLIEIPPEDADAFAQAMRMVAVMKQAG